MLILGSAVGQRFIVDVAVTGQTGGAIRPDQGEQVDALNHLMMFAAPMAGYQVHLARIRLIQGGVRSVRRMRAAHRAQLPATRRSYQAAGDAAVGQTRHAQGLGCFGCTLRCFGTGVHPLGRDQKLDIREVTDFRWIHCRGVSIVLRCLSTA